MTAYYNEIDPYAAQWLRNLIDAGHIAPGVVDERDIRDVKPAELEQYTQCHFFAGIGIWSLALRRAGWPDDKPVWTGSCPCQPFSAAGKGAGFVDERHLWPHWYHLITQCEPGDIFGEQVASKDGLDWLDLVQTDLAGAGYASGAVDLCAAGIGAPHIRQRLWFVAERLDNANNPGSQRRSEGTQRQRQRSPVSSLVSRLADADSQQRQWGRSGETCDQPRQIERSERLCDAERLADADSYEQRQGRRPRCENDAGHESGVEPSRCSMPGRLADPECNGHDRAERNAPEQSSDGQTDGLPVGGGEELRGTGPGPSGLGDANSEHPWRNAGTSTKTQRKDEGGAIGDRSCASGADGRPGPTNGFWRDADWLYCRDGKWRAVRSGSFPLADGAPSRVGRLRAYGNSINVEAAQAFIEAYLTDQHLRSPTA